LLCWLASLFFFFFASALQGFISGLIADRAINKRQDSMCIVLCTGDGNSNEKELGSLGFPTVVNMALMTGVRVVMFAWKAGCSRVYQTKKDDLFELYFLENFAREISN
jgi:hypothetical protein